jgi:23S rRNA (cytosine1962-C5)-methyltransferase
MVQARAFGNDPTDGYRLLDAGDGRRLEAFGGRIVDRPAATASEERQDPAAWPQADLRFDRSTGWWGSPAALEPWTMQLDGLTIELRPTASGQVGLYPEQLLNLPWLRAQVRRKAAAPSILNLFAYSGLVTLAVAAAGGSVAHVDAARSAVAWARHNAALSELGDRAIRWIVDDAGAFVAREARRGRRYDGIVLDPPSWGHGPDGAGWRLDARLTDLLAACAALAAPGGVFCLLSAHTTGLEPEALSTFVAEAFGRSGDEVDSGSLALEAASGAGLVLGAYAAFAS